jgi:hypothetical protein
MQKEKGGMVKENFSWGVGWGKMMDLFFLSICKNLVGWSKKAKNFFIF